MKKLSTILLFLSFLCCSYAQEVRDAQFPGGDKALQQFFRESVDYTGSFKSRKDFCVVAELLIKEDGTAVFSKVIKPKNAKERVVRQVKRLIKSMPAWEPATTQGTNGNTVAVKSLVEVTIPFTHNYYLGEGKTVVCVKDAGTLAELLTQEQQDTCSYLEIKGNLNSTDILTLRRMAGGDGGKGRLSRLELLDANIVNDDRPYLILEDAEKELVVGLHSVTNDVQDMSGMAPQAYDRNYIRSGSFPVAVYRLNEKENEERTGPYWKDIRKYRIKRCKGHRLRKNEDGTYTFLSFAKRKNFCYDMFFRCPQMRIVVLPYGTHPQNNVQVTGSNIRYYH